MMLLVTISSQFPIKNHQFSLFLSTSNASIQKGEQSKFELCRRFINLDIANLNFSKTFKVPNHDLGLVLDFRKKPNSEANSCRRIIRPRPWGCLVTIYDFGMSQRHFLPPLPSFEMFELLLFASHNVENLTFKIFEIPNSKIK